MMLVTELAQTVPEFWESAQLHSIVPQALLYCLEYQESRAMRLAVHHSFLPLTRSCPQRHAPAWLAPVLDNLLQLLATRLMNTWPSLVAFTRGELGEASSKQTEDEMVQEVCRGRPPFPGNWS
jgi:hypothetical protein